MFNFTERMRKMNSNLIVSPNYDSKGSTGENEPFKGNVWLADLIQNKWKDEFFIRSQLGSLEYKTLNNLNYQICVLEIKKLNDQHFSSEALAKQYIGIVKAIFEQYSFRVFHVVENNQLVILTFDLFGSKTRKEQLEKKELFQSIANQIHRYLNNDERNKYVIHMSVSSTHKGFKNMYFSYEEALKSLLLKSIFNSSIIFYDDLGAFQILLNLQEKKLLKSYVLRHLGPIIEEDQKKKSDLLKTLKIYLERDGSKQSVADELHIVRQSLYYRLEKIKELLGEDYMCTQNRLALQLAIQAYELLKFEMGEIG